MNPQLHCPRCGFTRAVTVRGLLARETDCPRCPDISRLELQRATKARPPDLPTRLPDTHVASDHPGRGQAGASISPGAVLLGESDERIIENWVLTARSVRNGKTHLLELSGDLDLASYETLDDELRRIEATDASRIVIDLSQLTFLDSAGIRLLVEADARSRSDSNRLRLIPGDHRVQRILQLCGLEESLPFVD